MHRQRVRAVHTKADAVQVGQLREAEPLASEGQQGPVAVQAHAVEVCSRTPTTTTTTGGCSGRLKAPVERFTEDPGVQARWQETIASDVVETEGYPALEVHVGGEEEVAAPHRRSPPPQVLLQTMPWLQIGEEGRDEVRP